MTATVPGEQNTQLNLHASTAKEFRELLGRIRDTAGLSGGQIAAKTGMPRSTAYSLTSTNRPGLPSNSEQVRAFVQACGLSATKVDVVMDLWNRLHAQADSSRNDLSALGVDPDLPLGDKSARTFVSDNNFYSWAYALDRKTTSLDLVHYILADKQRYARALALAKLLVILAAVFVGGLVMIAVLVPSSAQFIGTGLVAVVLAVIFGINGRYVGVFRKKGPR